MKQIDCAKAVALAALAAGGIVSTANAAVLDATSHTEVALSPSVGHASPVAYLQSIASASPNSVNVDQGTNHVHINEVSVGFEGGFEV